MGEEDTGRCGRGERFQTAPSSGRTLAAPDPRRPGESRPRSAALCRAPAAASRRAPPGPRRPLRAEVGPGPPLGLAPGPPPCQGAAAPGAALPPPCGKTPPPPFPAAPGPLPRCEGGTGSGGGRGLRRAGGWGLAGPRLRRSWHRGGEVLGGTGSCWGRSWEAAGLGSLLEPRHGGVLLASHPPLPSQPLCGDGFPSRITWGRRPSR